MLELLEYHHFVKNGTCAFVHFVEFIDATDSIVTQHQSTSAYQQQ